MQLLVEWLVSLNIPFVTEPVAQFILNLVLASLIAVVAPASLLLLTWLERKIIALPTTSGTGSEISDGIVLIDEAKQTKFLVLSTWLCPTVAITDPQMTLSMPPKIM